MGGYDRSGNLINKSGTLYTYDPLNRLTSITIDGNTQKFSYDVYNRLIDTEDKAYIYDGRKEIGSLEQNRLKEFRALRPGVESEVGNVLSVELEGKTYGVLRDNVGHCVGLVGEEEVEELYEYSAFRLEKVLDAAGVEKTEALSPWLFGFKRSLGGLVYFGHRFYDPQAARWLTQDPFGSIDGPNLYAYVKNNPLTHYDAFG